MTLWYKLALAALLIPWEIPVMIAIATMQLAIGGIIGSAMITSGGQTTAEGYRIAFGFFAVMAVLTFIIYSRAKDAKPC